MPNRANRIEKTDDTVAAIVEYELGSMSFQELWQYARNQMTETYAAMTPDEFNSDGEVRYLFGKENS